MGDSVKTDDSFRRVADVDDVTADETFVADVGDVQVALFYQDGEYFALNSVCPHQGGPLEQGKVQDQCVYCPWHGWQFDLETGEHVQGTDEVETYDVAVEDGDVFVRL